MSSGTNSASIAFQFGLKCKKHTEEDDNDIVMVNLDQVRNKDYSRLVCVVCQMEINQIENFKMVRTIGLKYIHQYQQKDIETSKEALLEGQLPLDKVKKDNCMTVIKKYQTVDEEKTILVEKTFSQFKDLARSKIDEAKKLGLDYYKRLKDAGDNLTDQYETIVDSSNFKTIINESKTEQELNKRTAQFIQTKFQSKRNNDILDKANKEFNTIHQEYTLDFFNKYNKEAETLANMITFNSERQEASKKALSQLPSSSVSSSSSDKSSAGGLLKEFVDSESSSTYTITRFSDSSESLSAPHNSSQDQAILKAVSVKTLDPKEHYQAIFRIDILNLSEFSNAENNFILLGLTNQLSGENPLSNVKLGLFIQNKKSTEGCSTVKYGNDLSLPASTAVIALNLCISKNIFYFSDSNKVSCNILPSQPNFDAQSPLSLFIASRGNVKITLVSLKAKQPK